MYREDTLVGLCVMYLHTTLYVDLCVPVSVSKEELRYQSLKGFLKGVMVTILIIDKPHECRAHSR